METIPLQFDPRFVEEMVSLRMEAEEEEGDRLLVKLFYQERDHFYAKWFAEVGFEALFRGALDDFPGILETNPLIFVKRAWERKEEGAELYGQGSQKTVLIRLSAARMNGPVLLQSFLRQELLHIQDMLDPVFQYSPDLPLGGDNVAQDELIRQRFRLLWDIYAEGRMNRRGWRTLVPLEARRREFQGAFSFWTEQKRETAFRKLAGEAAWTQEGLLQLAKEGRERKSE
ncbi:MAG: hypothetical protein HYU34_02210 [Candidatus Omnitrophica bacterium]|nr:hypothetical protein [Candidatus Omnitrophota bacterium]